MGSFDTYCEMCGEEKHIRHQCKCGACICEDCREDNGEECGECKSKSKPEKQKVTTPKIKR